MGKTALVEGLALRITEGNVPDSLKTVHIRTLDLGLLQAGAGVKGEFEQRLKNVIDAVQKSPERYCCLLMKPIPLSVRVIRQAARMRRTC